MSSLLPPTDLGVARPAVGFGIDIGGTGMKAAPVDLSTGELTADRFSIDTPKSPTPDRIAAVVQRLVARHEWSGPIGVCMPAVVTHGIVRSAANIDDSWIGVNGQELFADATGELVHLINDADAAGVAEMTWGAGRGRAGVVICLTFGTGIGSGLFIDGVLVPNTELGHLELDGHEAEQRAADSSRKRESLDWELWAERVDRYLGHVVRLFSPELIILGGGASQRPDKWVEQLDPGCELAVADFTNSAGIAGAALLAPVSTSG